MHNNQTEPEITELNPQINIIDAEYNRLLGYPPNHKIDGRAKQLKIKTAQWYNKYGHPWYYARQMDNIQLLEKSFTLNGIEFECKRLRDSFERAGTTRVFVVAASAGKECEEQAHTYWLEGKPDEYFFMEMYGSAVVEYLITSAGARFCAWADSENLAILPHYSPGYTGWNVSNQNLLMDVIKQGSKNSFHNKIDVLPSGMLSPKKSLLAVFGITSREKQVQTLPGLIPCENCSLADCPYRRAPYKRAVKSIESVKHLQAKTKENGSRDTGALLKNAAYSVNLKALKKWSEDRLQIRVEADGTYNAFFRYEGSTCSNMGRPLAYDYHIKISAAADGFRIKDAHCEATDSPDNGYTFMCEYRRNSRMLNKTIREEKPLLGQSLNAVFSWEHASKHSGCFCDKPSRNHKWRIVYEVIHYALQQKVSKPVKQ